jgi:sugar lactone lactonase YvrE
MAGATGSADGAGGHARFHSPAGIAADSAGNVYVADSGNNTIRKISPDGTVTTLAGTAGLRGNFDGTGAAAIFNGPTGMAIDSAGNVYVADTLNDSIREISPGGAVTTLAGTAGQIGSNDGTGAAARFNNPSGVAVDSSGNLFVADHSNDTIRMITSAGVVTTVVGSAGVTGFLPGSAPGVIGSPRGIAVSGSAVSFTFAYAIGVLTVQ